MKNLFFLFVTLLLCIFIVVGCSPLDIIFGPLGSIDVATYPSGAKVFLSDSDTGKITPCTITNLMKGSYKVKVILEDLSYTETVTVCPGCPTSVYKDLLPRLKDIIAKPDILYTNSGETRNFSMITAYYFDIDHKPSEIKLSDCNYIKDNDHALINSKEGTFTGISEGQTKINISYSEREFTKNDLVDIFVATFPTPSPEPEPEPSGEIVVTLDNWDQEYYESLGFWSMVHAYYTITNNSDKTINDYEIYFKAICIDDSIYYDSWYKEFALSSGESHSDYALVYTFDKEANTLEITDLQIDIFH